MTSHKPTSVRNRPGYIKDSCFQACVYVLIIDLAVVEFLEDPFIWVYIRTGSVGRRVYTVGIRGERYQEEII